MKRFIVSAIAFVAVLSATTELLQSGLLQAKDKNQQNFQTSDRCFACHNSLVSPTGEDISIGLSWQVTMMANSGRDPYWQAGVRRETIDHPTAKAAIEDECAICHMPMMRYQAHVEGRDAEVFSHLPFDMDKMDDRLAADGVSCSLCHQIAPDKLGTRDSLVGRFVVDTTKPKGQKLVYGPYEIKADHQTIMRSSSGGWKPTEGDHIKSSELCATCHTLITQALGPDGKVIGSLPEQMPYQEWLHSDYKESPAEAANQAPTQSPAQGPAQGRSCQQCHMPQVQNTPITRVLGEPRDELSQHIFVGGNFFMQRILGTHRSELSVVALPNEMEAGAQRTIRHLQEETARLSIASAELRNGRLEAEIAVENRSGHKFPTAYPSRRAWLHVTVRDRNGKTVFESGALDPSGLIRGNDNDADPLKYEPHYTQIISPDQVQIYEAIMVTQSGTPTTGLLEAVRYEKDNRLLPKGFDKRTADDEVGVKGGALDDPNFLGGGDRINYSVPVGNAEGPFTLDAELLFQPISYRWAHNLEKYDAFEPKRMVGYYNAMSSGSAVVIAKAAATR